MNIPYYRQDWDVSKYREMGFADEQICLYWKKSCCGVLCLKMVAEAFGKPEISIKEYIDRGQVMEAYDHDRGWGHAGLAALAREDDLEAGNFEGMTIGDLKMYLSAGCLVIISIPTAFLPKKLKWWQTFQFWKKFGGHLCLVREWETDEGGEGGFRVNHTSVKPEWNWENRFINIKTFYQGFTGRGIVIWKD